MEFFLDPNGIPVVVVVDYITTPPTLIYSYSLDRGLTWTDYEDIISSQFDLVVFAEMNAAQVSIDQLGNMVSCFANYNGTRGISLFFRAN